MSKSADELFKIMDRWLEGSPRLACDALSAIEEAGWQLVPKELTADMVMAFDGHDVLRSWDDMLAAAPKVQRRP